MFRNTDVGNNKERKKIGLVTKLSLQQFARRARQTIMFRGQKLSPTLLSLRYRFYSDFNFL